MFRCRMLRTRRIFLEDFLRAVRAAVIDEDHFIIAGYRSFSIERRHESTVLAPLYEQMTMLHIGSLASDVCGARRNTSFTACKRGLLRAIAPHEAKRPVLDLPAMHEPVIGETEDECADRSFVENRPQLAIEHLSLSGFGVFLLVSTPYSPSISGNSPAMFCRRAR